MSDFFRGRRLRTTPVLRDMLRETEIRPQDLIMPYFVVETDKTGVRNPISSMPGIFQLSLDELDKQVAKAMETGLRAVLLFGIPAQKDSVGSGGYSDDGIVQQAVRMLKKRHGHNLLVICDTCLCEYTSHGHCGLLSPTGEVLNDPSLELLAKVAVSQVKAGADMVAPSDMMDGRVRAIREALDENGYINTPIMSYAVKYAGPFYGPFREAAESAPQSGDRKSYQMDPGNRLEAMLEAGADISEDADIIIVKPAGPYLDIIRDVRNAFDKPLCGYQVSGEYSMIKAAGERGWIDETAVMMESLVSIKRAGAGLIITYFAEDILAKGLI